MAEEQGVDPDTLPFMQNKPELFPDLTGAYNAFYMLHAGRGYTSGMDSTKLLPISFDSILGYARIYGYADDVDEFDEFHRLLRIADSIYVKFYNTRSPTPPETKREGEQVA